jgi:hypothetical protein
MLTITSSSAPTRVGVHRPRAAAVAAPNAAVARRSHARPTLAAAAALPPQQQTTATTTASAPSSPTSTTAAAFASAASGEWEGAAAAFSRDGSPVELPPRFVPDAFREWGVAVCDWQTQCSTDAGVDGEGGSVRVAYRLKRLLPSVGCEADATAFVDEGVSLDLGSGGGVFGADGAFVSAPPSLPASPADPPARVEVGLPLPLAACRAAPDGSVPPRRVRAVLTLAADPLAAAGEPSSSPPSVILTGVELFSEKRYADFSNGSDSLAGCGGGVGPFAGGARLEPAALDGEWAPAAGTAADPARGTDGGAGTRLLLPLGAWAAVRPAADGVVVEAGFVVESGDAGGSVRRAGVAAFDGAGRLVDTRLSAETAGGGQL